MLRAIGIIAIGLSMVVTTFAEGLLVVPGKWEPFLERLEKDEFLAVEHTLGGTLSDEKPELLIYRAGGKELVSAFSVFRTKDNGYRLAVTLDGGNHELVRKTFKLPPDFAARLLAGMQLCLTKQLYAPTGKAYLYPVNRGGGAYWINLQVNESTAVAGVVLTERCMTGRDSYFPFLELMFQLAQIADANGSSLGNFAQLDNAIDLLQRSYPVRR